MSVGKNFGGSKYPPTKKFMRASPRMFLFYLYYYNTKIAKRKIFLKILCINLPHPLLLYGGDRMTKINYPQRLAVSLTQEQYDKLQHLSEEKSVSMANLVRAAV